jgi:hypothetical protein
MVPIPSIEDKVRRSKRGVWLQTHDNETWRDDLLDLLEALKLEEAAAYGVRMLPRAE